jgi:3-methylfumaryl-CoA hydratase
LISSPVKRFEFRAVSPIFDTADFVVAGKPKGEHTIDLWAKNASGALAMTATAII